MEIVVKPIIAIDTISFSFNPKALAIRKKWKRPAFI
jgi:hypothetical protein